MMLVPPDVTFDAVPPQGRDLLDAVAVRARALLGGHLETDRAGEVVRLRDVARVELAAAEEFDVVIVNDDLVTAVTRLERAMGLVER